MTQFLSAPAGAGPLGGLQALNGALPVSLASLIGGPSRNSGGSQQRRNVEAQILWSVSASTLSNTYTFPAQPVFFPDDWADQLDIWIIVTVALTNGGTGPTGIGFVLEVFDLNFNNANSGTVNTATCIPAGGNTNLIGVGPLITATPTFAIVTAPTASIPYGAVTCTVAGVAAFGPGVIMRIPYGSIGAFGLIRPGLATLGASPWTGGTIQVLAHSRA